MTGIWLVSYVALWIMFLVVAFVLLSVLRNLGVIYESISARSKNELPSKLVSGEVPPEIRLFTLSGEALSTSIFRGKSRAIAIISPTCEPCRQLLKKIADGQQLDPFDPTIQNTVIVSIGDTRSTTSLIQQFDLYQDVPVLVDLEAEIAREWGIRSTPTTLIVDDQMKIVRHIIGLEGEPVELVNAVG